MQGRNWTPTGIIQYISCVYQIIMIINYVSDITIHIKTSVVCMIDQ